MKQRYALGAVLLLAVGALAIVLVFSHRTVLTASRASTVPTCRGATSQAQATGVATYLRTVTVDYNNGAPVLRDSLVLSLPATQPSARDLLEDQSTVQFRTTLFCAVGSNQAWSRSTLPDVRLRAGSVVVIDNFQEDIPTALSLGVSRRAAAAATLQNDGTWLLTVNPLEGLQDTPCTNLAVSAPSGALSATDGDSPATKDPDKATFTACDSPHTVVVRPDFKTAVFAAAAEPAAAVANSLIRWLPAASAAALLIVLVARDKRRRHLGKAAQTSRRPIGPVKRLVYGRENDQDRPGERIGWSVEGLLVPVLVLAGVTVLNEIVLAVGTLASPWPYRCVLLTLAAAVWVALRWRLSAGLVAVLALGGLVCWIYGLTATAGQEYRVFATSMVLSCLIQILLWSALLNCARLLLRPFAEFARASLGEPVCWAVGVLLATVVVIERDIDIAHYSTANYGSYPYTPGAPWFGYLATLNTPAFLAQFFTLAVVLLPLGLIRYVTDELGTISEPDDRGLILATAAFVVFWAETWSFMLWGWGVPLWIVLVPLTLLAFSRRRHVVDQVTHDNTTIRRKLRTTSASDLRREAVRWRSAVQEGRNIEKAFAGGSIELEKYTERIEQLDRREGTRLYVFGHTRGRRHLTPVEVLLVAGPGMSPIENARQAAALAARGGALVASAILVFRIVVPTVTSESASLSSYVLACLVESISVFGTWTAAGFAIGLAWQYLPGHHGPIKVLLPAALCAVTPAIYLTAALLGDRPNVANAVPLMIEAVTFWAGMTIVGLAMDLRSLRPTNRFWTPRRNALTVTYGMQNLRTQVAFVLAQGVAIVAIATFVVSQVNHPNPPATTQTSSVVSNRP
ncbi:DUF6185 family protein [Actinomycetospora sp.]|uniref:DUF6185 family protein n=1 Tax=Actinomycetospora sp. TaxID=1872135 RepID=UPI002F3FB089